jgi:hypothetical protein
MGAQQSSRAAVCGLNTDDESFWDLTCGLNGTRKRPPLSSDPALETVARWIAAREAGNVEEAASYCHEEFVFASPQLSLAGLEAAKRRLFAQKAPSPVDVVAPLQSKPNSTEERPVFFREVAFRVGEQLLTIRQEWVVILGDGSPLIGSVSAARVGSPSG